MNQLIARGYQFKFDLKQLRSFLAVAEKLSFRGAAEVLFISQPALSKHIAQLEAALECKLFIRDKNSVVLTNAGKALYSTLPIVLEQLQQTVASLKTREEGAETIKIGYTCAAMASFFPGLIREVRQALPACEFEFSEAMTDKLIEDVTQQHLHGAFIMSRPEDPKLKRIDIRSEPLGLMLPDNHFLAMMKEVSLSSLAKETLILFPRQMNPMLFDDIIQHCEQSGFYPKKIVEAQSGHAAIGFVAAGAGIAFIVHSMATACLKGTCFRPLTSPAPRIKYSFITHPQAEGEWLNVFEQQIQQMLSPKRRSSQATEHGDKSTEMLLD
jgi:DNA-binding transcriptional LysR family regulator